MTVTDALLLVLWVMTIGQGIAWHRRPHAYVYDEWPGRNPRFFHVTGAIFIATGILFFLLTLLQTASE